MAMLRRSVDLETVACDSRRHEIGIRVPCKKMKKRRELDALVAKSHKSLSAVYKSGGGGGFPSPHGPLLKNDSDSGSDLEGFPSVVSPTHQSACCKSTGGRGGGGLWVPAWLFLIVLIGTLVSATLLWLHIGLKQDFTLLRNHLAKVDAEGKRVPDSFRDVDQRLTQLQANQSQVARQFEQLSLRLDQIARDVGLVNGSAQQLRGSIAEAVNNQMPSHLSQLNESVHDLQSKISSLSGELATVRLQLTSVEGRSQQRLHQLIDSVNASVNAIQDIISGRDTKSALSREFNKTVELAISRAQNESSSRFAERLASTLQEIKRESATTTPATMLQPQDLRQPLGVMSQQEDKPPVVNKLEDLANEVRTEIVSPAPAPATSTAAPLANNHTGEIEISDIGAKPSDAKDEPAPIVTAAAAT